MNTLNYDDESHYSTLEPYTNYTVSSKILLKNNQKSVDLINRMFEERNMKSQTRRGYENALIYFCKFYGDNDLEDFINYCLREEDARVPERKKMLKKVLLDYRVFLKNSPIAPSVKKSYFQRFLTFLRHYEVEIPNLPLMKLEKSEEISYYDIPTPEHVKQACDIADLEFKSLILFMSSSGTAKAEVLSLTIGDWIKGCCDYYPDTLTDLEEIIDYLIEKVDIVPILYIHRKKTDKNYYTCCSPEASYYINRSIKSRFCSKLTEDSPLFSFKDGAMVERFKKVNDALGWGFVGKYRFFRSHILRKFFASNIGLTPDLVDAFEGRSKNKIHDTYIKTNPKELRDIYRSNMHRVMIYNRDVVRWDSVPPKLTTQYKDNDTAVITLRFTMPTCDVNKCVSFINNTFYTN